MARSIRLVRAFALLALLAATAVHAQNDLPDLSTATQATATTDDASTTAESTAESTTGATTDATTTGDSTSAESTSGGTTTAESTTGATSSAESTTDSAATTTATFPDATSTSSGSNTPFSLTGLPTIQGAGIPTMIVPYTANAPFMQKSTMPEGTVFIAVGAVLAFLGACVLLWRGLVAWSINRSVKRAALASLRGSDKGSSAWGGGGHKSAYYREYETGSSMSLDALTSAGKNIRSSHIHDEKRQSAVPPAGLFFSPTAQVSNRASSVGGLDSRASGYLPAGYYASPSAAEPAGGRNSTTIGGSLAPYARHSAINPSPSPPGSPSLPNSRSTANYYGGGNYSSRDGLRSQSRENLRASSRDGYGVQRNSNVYMHPSTSSLAVGTGGGYTGSSEHLGGQRAPSAVFSDLLENHGSGPRERF
ncbi:hypothetical protein M409DRAFT_30656 [Zasmidium cellare ATCC 36951]|uniref:Csi2 protein n=1 Tax=Zasmidium cellare ATCC 36951 TaxID=1080233 RepID=A0A6A6BZA9_ZASCE|nr:uncharacterized protein M409DRAFT_30656 [Zasmidium cellare ATCC 36951]KAF2158869.1 hypothetical protein M409DRAFT_30656 [Zasmidium cellare ATCC 36951]